jgi:hypothetical protein
MGDRRAQKVILCQRQISLISMLEADALHGRNSLLKTPIAKYLQVSKGELIFTGTFTY